MVKNSMVFYRSFWDTYKELPDREMAREFLEAIIQYGLDERVDTKNPVVLAMMNSFKAILDSARIRYAKSIENGKNGGRPRQINHERVISLREEGYSQKDVSTILGISEKQVRNIENEVSRNKPVITGNNLNVNVNVNDNVNFNGNVNANEDGIFDDEFVDYSTDQPEMPF